MGVCLCNVGPERERIERDLDEFDITTRNQIRESIKLVSTPGMDIIDDMYDIITIFAFHVIYTCLW